MAHRSIRKQAFHDCGEDVNARDRSIIDLVLVDVPQISNRYIPSVALHYHIRSILGLARRSLLCGS